MKKKGWKGKNMKKIIPLTSLIVLLVTSFLYIGCERPEKKAAMPKKDAPKMSMEEVRKAEKMAGELWSKMQGENYREDWEMWPGKEAFYKGKEPHGVLLTTYVNDAAYEAIENKEGKMPPGAIIIKENYMPDKTLGAITVMHKIEGFNPEANDWFWVKFGPDGKVMTMEMGGMTMKLAGKVPGCIDCHGVQSSNDYIFTNSLK